MEKEVDPRVLAVIDEKRLSGPRLTPVEIVAKMGVFDARDKPYEHAWMATGDNVIATIWAEYLSVGDNGRWFYLESLDAARRAGGGERSAQQMQRAKDRLALLKKTFDTGSGFRVVLQTNRIAIAELETSRSAKVSTRVRDDDEWHVASWEPEEQLAILVRGPRGWSPSADEVQAARARAGLPAEADPALAAAAGASTDDLREAAMGYVSRHFGGYGYRPEDVSAQGLGWDIEVSNAKGAMLLKVAVKGTSTALPTVTLTEAERAASKRDPLWRLLVVADAASPAAQHKIYKPTEMGQAPGFVG